MYTKPYSEHAAFVAVNQISNTVSQIHSMGVLHLDLKPQNILIEFCSINQFKPECAFLPVRYSLSDFGVSQKFDLKKDRDLKQLVFKRGTSKFMAPEQLDSSL